MWADEPVWWLWRGLGNLEGLGSIHNANQAVIEEAARFARPRAVQYIVIKLLYFSTMYISSITGGAQAYECFYKPPPIY